MTGHFVRLLEGIVANPSRPVGALPLLGGAELRQILKDWNDTAYPLPEGGTLPELFEAQVSRTP